MNERFYKFQQNVALAALSMNVEFFFYKETTNIITVICLEPLKSSPFCLSCLFRITPISELVTCFWPTSSSLQWRLQKGQEGDGPGPQEVGRRHKRSLTRFTSRTGTRRGETEVCRQGEAYSLERKQGHIEAERFHLNSLQSRL